MGVAACEAAVVNWEEADVVVAEPATHRKPVLHPTRPLVGEEGVLAATGVEEVDSSPPRPVVEGAEKLDHPTGMLWVLQWAVLALPGQASA